MKYRNYIAGIIVLLFVVSTGCSNQAESDPMAVSDQNNTLVSPSATAITSPTVTYTPVTPTLTSTSTPAAISTPIEVRVPYSKTSVWNTPIGAAPKYDVYSDEMVATLVNANDGKIITAGPGYNFPVYFADKDTPRWDVPCLINKCTTAFSDKEIERSDMVRNVPIPEDAKPGEGSDARIIVIDTITHMEYDLSKAQRTATGWEAGTVSVYNILWDGTPVGHSSRGSGIPAYAGLLRPWEIRQGRIEHALAFGYTETAPGKCVFPASKTDGESLLPFAIPQGARLQLDPSLTEADFDKMGLDETGKIIARALQEYGMILVDTSGAFKIYVEDLENNPYATEQWTDPELNLTRESIYGIPYTAFRVLELPPGYWEPSVKPVYHGKCLKSPTTPQ